MECVKFDNPSKVDMSEYALREASGLLKTIAGARRADESVKAVFHRLSRDLKDWSYGRIRAVWYRDHRVKIRAAEIEQLRAIANRRVEDKAAVSELTELRNRISRLEALLESSDEAFHSEAIASLRSQRRTLG
jgi:hypothetical protein